ncbi:MAG: DNA-binding protein, partial [Actinomycetota bacterium]|nr:DNA-binding protein [Actinomycetota bacterium]
RADTLQRQLYTRINSETGHTWGKTEPGWNARTPERPRLLRRWMEECYGSVSVEALAAHDLIYPTDLLADILAGQREAPARVTAAPETASAVLDDGAILDRGDTVVQLRRPRRQA